jgi:hypothetical protein
MQRRHQLSLLFLVVALLATLVVLPSKMPIVVAADATLASFTSIADQGGLQAVHPNSGLSYSAFGESFNSTYSAVPTVASFYVAKYGSPIGNLTATIYAHTGTYGSSGKPTGAALVTSSLLSSASIGSAAWYNFTFSSSVKLLGSMKYFVCIEVHDATTINGSNYFIIYFNNGGGYEGNMGLYYSSAWHADSADTCFILYGHATSFMTIYPSLMGRMWSSWTTDYNTTAWTTAVGYDNLLIDIGQSYLASDGKYKEMRSAVRFATQILPDRCVLFQADLYLHLDSDFSTTDFTIRVQNWTGASDGLSAGDFQSNGTTLYDTGISTGPMIPGITYGDSLTTSFISVAGYTDLFIRSSLDIAKTTPTAAEWVRMSNPFLYIEYDIGPNVAPTIGEFAAPTTLYSDGEYALLNVTVKDADGVADFFNATMNLTNSIVLGWDAVGNSFSEVQDDDSIVTLGSCTRTAVNGTAYTLSFNVTLAAGLGEGYVNCTGAIVWDASEQGSSSQDDFFFFHIHAWVLAEEWDISLRGKSFRLVEMWGMQLGRTILVSTKQMRMLFFFLGLGLFFGPIGLIFYKRPKASTCVVLLMMVVFGLACLLAFTYM